MSLCAVIDAESEDAASDLIAKHYPDATMRFLETRPDDWQPNPGHFPPHEDKQ